MTLLKRLPALAILMTACSQPPQYEYYPNLVSTADLALTQPTHPHGWARVECFSCHNIANIHQVDRIGVPETFLQKAQQDSENQGVVSCSQCHGYNGVPQ
jgi:hypothetical protein